jgi:hypothetical protein
VGSRLEPDTTAVAGAALTVEEADGSPTDAAVAKIVFPNGTLAIASHVATYTPPAGPAAIAEALIDAKGDLIVGSAADTAARLAVGATTGHVLTVDPGETLGMKWAAGGGGGALVLLEQHTAANSATLDFTTCISATYDEYLIELHNVLPASGANNFYMRCSTDGGSTYDSGSNYNAVFSYLYETGSGNVGAGGTSFFLAGTNVGNSTMGVCGSLRLFDPLGSSLHKGYRQETFYYHDSLSAVITQTGVGRYKSNAAVNALRFFFGSGNIASGTIRVYGIAK